MLPLCINEDTKNWFNTNNILRLSVLVETDVVSLFSETLTTDVQTVLSDQTRVRATDTTLAGAFTVVSWVGIPDVFVSHNAVQKKNC